MLKPSLLKKTIAGLLLFVGLSFLTYKFATKVNINPTIEIGTELDTLHGVPVFYNGGVNHVLERNLAKDGYNLGLKYQCVEFVKRYYYQYLNHKMPDSYGHARSFYDPNIASGAINKQRGLLQFSNNIDAVAAKSTDIEIDSTPMISDLLVFKPTVLNPYGHVAIVSNVDLIQQKLEIIQQNPGPFSPPRESFDLEKANKHWRIKNSSIYGWLRMPSS
jgi:hypothetical protein